jgi:hypothetical protein
MASAATRDITGEDSRMEAKQKGVDEIHAALKEEAKALDDRDEANIKRMIKVRRREAELAERVEALVKRERELVEREKLSNARLKSPSNASGNIMYNQSPPGPGMYMPVSDLIAAKSANNRLATQLPPSRTKPKPWTLARLPSSSASSKSSTKRRSQRHRRIRSTRIQRRSKASPTSTPSSRWMLTNSRHTSKLCRRATTRTVTRGHKDTLSSSS